MTAAAKHIMDAGRPLRTIRIVWFGAEEPGGLGGKAYAAAHGREPHAIAGESDFGADRVWRFGSHLMKSDPELMPGSQRRSPRSASPRTTRARPTAPTSNRPSRPARRGFRLNQDGTRYFDWHHTPDDTLDKVDPAQLRQNVAAWTTMLAILSAGIESEPKRHQRR